MQRTSLRSEGERSESSAVTGSSERRQRIILFISSIASARFVAWIPKYLKEVNKSLYEKGFLLKSKPRV